LKTKLSTKTLLGIGAATAVAVVGLVIYFVRATDPATQAPIPYKKFDYSAHMQDQARQYGRQGPAPSDASQLGR